MSAHPLDSLEPLVAFLAAPEHSAHRACWEPRYDRTVAGERRCCCGHPLAHHHPCTEGALL